MKTSKSKSIIITSSKMQILSNEEQTKLFGGYSHAESFEGLELIGNLKAAIMGSKSGFWSRPEIQFSAPQEQFAFFVENSVETRDIYSDSSSKKEVERPLTQREIADAEEAQKVLDFVLSRYAR